jgi:hypothetical protein
MIYEFGTDTPFGKDVRLDRGGSPDGTPIALGDHCCNLVTSAAQRRCGRR